MIGTRGSSLALWQANHVQDALKASRSDLEVCLKIIRTKGDEALDGPFHVTLDKGLFTRKIEEALLAGAIDLAVHSLKDLPTELPDGLTLAAITSRQDPADVLVSKDGQILKTLGDGAEVLTGSLRRRAQLLHRRPNLRVSSVRGNVETRLMKLSECEAQAIVLARAGLVRLGLGERVTERLDPAQFVPACGQGALAIETRCDDLSMREMLHSLDDLESRRYVTAERAFLATLEGGCQVPIGAYARGTPGGETLTLTGMVANLDGSRLLQKTIAAAVTGAEAAKELGQRLAEELRNDGAMEILDEVTNLSQSQESW
ncbi:MAG: hydroxymethylbilane synthase [Planctomycetota bacterium]|nr:hydroxymethylbilane synthase [Planctomycetota bacterium]